MHANFRIGGAPAYSRDSDIPLKTVSLREISLRFLCIYEVHT